MKRYLSLALALALCVGMMAGCSKTPAAGTPAPNAGSSAPVATPEPAAPQTEVEKVIAEAQTMSFEDLCKKAIEESNGKTLYGVGNSSRGKSAGATFVEMLQKIDPAYTGAIEWSQPKNNMIFAQLSTDTNSSNPQLFMTLIQDGSQIQSKMLDTGLLLNFIPKEWKEATGVNEETNGHPLALQTLNKVFMFNNLSGKTFTNCWDFVAEGVAPMFMGVDSEPVGRNFLLMLTRDDNATNLKDAFDKLSAEQQAYFKPTIDAMESEAADLGLTSANAKYALTWIKLWCEQYNEQTDDGPICNTLVTTSAAGESGLLVYSKLRSVEESPEASVNNITVAAYQDGYTGIGGYAYKHYLQIPKNTPYPWTACAFISYMVTSQEGFAPWGKDMGGYSSNPACNQDHSKDGYKDKDGNVTETNLFDAKNDRGYDWWTSKDGGQLVVEDPAYCASVAYTVGDWIDIQG
ncbi:MAG: hypothetical protein EOM52_01300 [Clostridia bacterium]|nr:hypothetical protein [Clostridia bacterium]